MRLAPTVAAIGLAVLVGCAPPPAEPTPVKPDGDRGSPVDEFRTAHEAVVELTRRLDELRAVSDETNTISHQPEAIALARSLTAAQRATGRLGREVGVADPTGPLGADALFSCLQFSLDGMADRREALDLAVKHYPHDPRLGDFLYAILSDRVPDHVRDWIDPVLDRVLADSRNPAVLAAAQTSRGRLMLRSTDPAVVAAGERLLQSVQQNYPDETVGGVRVATWASALLGERTQSLGAVGSTTVRLRS